MERLVSFGKYKGKAVRELLGDVPYAQWLKHQGWLKGWLRELLDEEAYCGLCNDSMSGMYAGEGTYIKCPGCGYGGRSNPK